MLLQYALAIPTVALVLMLISFMFPDKPFIPILSGIFWLIASYGIASVKIYLPLDMLIDSITFTDDWILITLFGGCGILMLAYGIGSMVSYAEDQNPYGVV